MILGGVVQRKRGTYSLHRPGADHHARWMSKALYTLKVILILPQFPSLPWYRKKQLEKMSLFIVFVYLTSWFTAPLLYSAATADLSSSLPDSDLPLEKPKLPNITPKSSLEDFVVPRSKLLFRILDVPHSFLSSLDWSTSPEFEKIKGALNNLTLLNDSCERALALATTFNGIITKDETTFQELVLIVDSHRKKYKLQRKKDFKKLL